MNSSRIRTSTEYNNECSYTTPKLPDTQRTKSKLFESFAINHKTVANQQSVHSEQFNNNIEIINKQLNNIVLNDQQILYIPKVNQQVQGQVQMQVQVRGRKGGKGGEKMLSMQHVNSISVVGGGGNDKEEMNGLKEENQDLKEHVNFLLNQIKKLQKSNVASCKSIIDLGDVSQLKIQAEENKVMMITMQRDYEIVTKENRLLREQLKVYQTIKSRADDYDDNDNDDEVQGEEEEEEEECSKNDKRLLEDEYITQTIETNNKKEEDINDNDLSMQLYNNVLCNTNELFLMKLFKEDKTILWFNKSKRTFAYDEYIDNNDSFTKVFDEDKTIYFTKGNYLYIVTGRFFFYYDHLSHTVNELPLLQRPHNKGALLQYENRLLCISGMESEAVEEYLDTSTWTYLPSLKSPRADASYLILNKSTLYTFFGYDYKRRTYLSSIEYINLAENWSCWKSYTNLSISIRKHNTFLASDDMIYIIGGQGDTSYNNTFIRLSIASDTISSLEKMTNVFPKMIYDSLFYEYLDIGTGDLTKISYDEDNNIHLINTVTLYHTTITYI